MESLILFIEKDSATTRMEYIADSPAPDGSITGRFLNEPEETLPTILAPFLGPSKQGKVFTYKPGHRYTVTNLTAQGKFKLVPAAN